MQLIVKMTSSVVLILFAVITFSIAQGRASFVSTDGHEVQYADTEFLVKQKQILLLFHHVYQTDFHDDLWAIADGWVIPNHFAEYKNGAGEEFWKLYMQGNYLPMDEIFSINMRSHEQQAVALFHLFTSVDSWDVFYKTAVWARFHINTDMFVYAFTAAFIHHDKLTKGLALPPIYEINPYHFYTTDVIQEAQNYKMREFYGISKVDDVYKVYIESNYTEWFDHYTDESKIAYFTEDVDWNAYYYYFHMDYPYWLGGDEWGLKNDRRGEYYIYQYEQFLARYHLERVSNGLPPIEPVNYYHEQGEGYYPNLRYFNGMMFPYRTDFTKFKNHDWVELVQGYERRAHRIIDEGHFVDEKEPTFASYSVEYLGNLMQANKDSETLSIISFWENIGKGLMSRAFTFDHDYNVIPGVLDHFETSLREPLFYAFYKRYLNIFNFYRKQRKPYTHDQLNFEGVRITDADMDKLFTYFDYVNADITNVVYVNYHDGKNSTDDKHWADEDFVIYAHQKRLTHVPFTVTLNVQSSVKQKVIVKFFIAPKYDENGHEIRFVDQTENWYELEHFVHELQPGENTIERKSTDFTWFIKDRTTTYDLYRKVMLGLAGTQKFSIDNSEAHCGFPQRLMLPRGNRDGFDITWFFMVYSYHAPAIPQFTGFDPKLSCGIGSGARYVDALPFGFPFNRPIDPFAFDVENIFIYDTKVHYKPTIK